MRRPFLLYALPLSLLFVAGLTEGQVAPGTQAFVAYDRHEVDSINLSNNNVMLNAQIMGKNGAMGFNFGVNGSFYLLGNTGTFQASMLYSHLYRAYGGLSETANGFLATSTYTLSSNTTSTVNCPISGTTTKYSNWAIVGPDGSLHALPTTVYSDKTAGGTSCLSGSGFTSTTIDNSGITAVVAANGTSPSSVYFKNGTILSATAITDSNGNSISLSSGAYTDSMGLTPLTVTGTYPSNTFTWTDVNSGSPHSTVGTISKAFVTNFQCSTIEDAGNLSASGWPSGISYPDGTSLNWTYDPTRLGTASQVTGRLGTITLREGGTIAYTYSGGTNGIDCTYWDSPVITRTLGNNDVTTYTLTHPQIGTSANYQAVNTVLDPGGNETVYTFTGFTSTGNSTTYAQVLTMVKRYQGSSTLLTTDKYCYNTNATNCDTATVTMPITEVDVYHTIYGMSNSSRQQTKYDVYGNVTYSAAYDFGGTTPMRATTTTYYQAGTSCGALSAGSNINDKPCEVSTTQGGSTIADAKYTYDSHGNLLKTSLWNGSLWIGQTTSNAYNSNGTPSDTYDLANNHTAYTYDSTMYSDGCTGATQYPFATTITKDGLSTSATYDCTGGVKLTDVDANGNTTTHGYKTSGGTADPYWRVSSVTDPYSAVVSKTYATGAPFVGNSSFSFNSGNSINSTTSTTDGYGRTVKTQTTQAPSGTNFDTVTVTYGWNGNLLETKNSLPCSTTSSGTCTTVHTNDTDPLGRLLTSVTASNETLTHTYTQNDDLAILTPAPSGEGNKQVQTEYDGLGRISKVCHIGSTASTGSGTACNQKTGSANGATDAYTYGQGSGHTTVSVTRGSQTRTITYDALGRMTQKVTPEGGTWTYYYDTSVSGCASSGNFAGKLTCVKDPNNNEIVYLYDSLGRVTDIGAGPWGTNSSCKRFRYDNTTGVLGALPTGVTLANQYGRLAEAATDDCVHHGTAVVTDEWFAYDEDGRKTDIWESPYSGLYYHSVATFFENGAVKTLQLANPSLYTLAYTLDGEGRWYSLTDTTSGQTLVTKATYYPAANPAVVSLTGTTPDNDAYTFDANTGRMTQYVFTVGNTPKTLKGVLNWNPNGSLASLTTTDGFNAGGSLTCLSNSSGALGHGYDDWGRLNEFDCGSGNWGQQYAYDTNDNLTKTVLSGRTGTNWNPGYSSSTNRCTGCSFDSDGDTTADGSGSNYWGWDEFAKMKWWNTSSIAPTCGTNGKCLIYDAFGRIVKYSNGTGWYDVWITQLGSTTTMTGSTIDFSYWPAPGGRGRVEINSSTSGYNYLHGDWLGNARLLSSVANNTEYRDSAYTPYGEQFATYGLTQSYYQSFAGMTGDFNNGVQWETPNRELSIVGRWLSPDPAGAGWNQYAYATNPNSATDPTGLFVWYDGVGNDPSGYFPSGVAQGSAGGCSSSCGLASGQVSFGNDSVAADELPNGTVSVVMTTEYGTAADVGWDLNGNLLYDYGAGLFPDSPVAPREIVSHNDAGDLLFSMFNSPGAAFNMWACGGNGYCGLAIGLGLAFLGGEDEEFPDLTFDAETGVTSGLLSLAGYNLDASFGMVGDTFNMNVRIIAADNSEGVEALSNAIVGMAEDQGASDISVTGSMVTRNPDAFGRLATSLGWTYTAIDSSTFNLTRSLP